MISDPTKYAPGTPGYARIAAHYSGGTRAADFVYAAALTMRDGAVTDALNQLTDSNGQPPSAWNVFWTQIYNDPLGAPIEQAEKILENTGNAVKDAATKAAGNLGVWLIVGVVVVGAFLYFGGAALLKRKIAQA